MTDESRTREQLLSRLQGYLDQDPGNWNLRAQVFDVALAAGAAAAAAEQVERALRERPGDAPWRNRHALLLLATGRHAEAQAELESLVAEGHRDPVVEYNLAFALFEQGSLEAATERVAPLRDGPTPEAGRAWALWLRCQHRLNRLEEALEQVDAHAPQFSPEAWGVASLLAVDGGRLDSARAWSERAIAVQPDQLEAVAARATLALGDLDAQGATALFTRALQAHPTEGRCWSGLGYARLLARDLTGADEAFRKAVAHMPNHIGTWIAWGWCRVMAGQPEAAREAFEAAVRLDRNFGESHGALAVALARLDLVDQARREVEIALRLDREGASVRYARALLDGKATKEDLARMAHDLLAKSGSLLARAGAKA